MKANQRVLSESLKSKTKELFPDDAERLLEYFATKLEYHFKDYKSLKGFTPSENLIKVLFIHCLRGGDINLENGCFVSYLPFCLKHFYYGSISSITEYEVYPMISPLEYIGSDGCGGSYFCDMSNQEDIFYHVWEEFEGISKVEYTLTDILRLRNENAEELYHEVRNEFNNLFSDNKPSYTTILEKSYFDKLTHLAVGLSLTNSAYMPITKFDYSYDYFVTYLKDEEGDYFKYDNVVNSINSQLLTAFYQLYFTNHLKELKKLLQLTMRKTKGRIFNSHRDFFNDRLTAEVELKKRIVVNFKD